ncbi:DNA topoisomerase I [Mycoplasmopsis californica HAZ160_1]|uniref:DNA topoisomerase 1 n=1 Tax=Mycoplasmopsis californica HAZ160_1 TaxID=1397850 RepID=A0AAT9F837_9BACT|nr:type I DNA topoisomerase [Mycoplasmopsis californica]BAP01011.1 DNA topoisomerase I [Mycoplasmopsis californica HAZ160_1]BBG40876.1 DNA topoisomerase I [Mycoplasmopsis californica]BBG41470.1 DNA topoisomerase I [Mycoplasmopsis californica]BBG42063.1 DNA topoisomerase I [Mycoplasmopsis californica]BBG42646.1 DNA topoisomerase I [Mycoplasmopsis californica]
MSKLVIVESPNKVATIQKYLGKEYEVVASVGHITKLSTKNSGASIKMGINVEEWEPVYVLDPVKRTTVKKLKDKAAKAEEVLIATDPDREGEAIGDHLVKFLKCEQNYSRVKYNEITKEAILNAVAKSGKLDQALIDAQKARRMLDRIIGFKLSNLIKQKLSNSPTNPSAGRVQSIALKLIVDREAEIEAFIPRDYHKAIALINQNVKAIYFNEKNTAEEREWIYPHEKDFIENALNLTPKSLVVSDIKETKKRLGAITPLKQSALYKKSPFSSASTQAAAQRLYEGYGDGGLISYPRTDSTRLSQYFIDNARKFIIDQFGAEYVSKELKGFSGDQDAHEAIRPTDISLNPEIAREKFNLNNYDYKIYKLIYEHTLQALITPPLRASKAYTFVKGDLKFKYSASKILFPGYYVVKDDKEDAFDPGYELGQIVNVEEFVISDHQTQPPARYSEGSLIEALDNIKVGRPSTFASTVKIVLERLYAENQNGSLHPTDFGKIVMHKLIDSFPDIIEEGYTALVEEELDMIAQSKVSLKPVMQSFWDKFNQVYTRAEATMEHTQIAHDYLNEICEKDGGDLVIRTNKANGNKFVGCKNFPKCRYTRNLDAKTN